MNQPEDELVRALRTARRSLESANVAVLMEDAHKNIADAVGQLTFVLERLVEEQKRLGMPDPHVPRVMVND